MHASIPSYKCFGRRPHTSHVLFHVQHAALHRPHAHLPAAFQPQGAHACPSCAALPQATLQGSANAKEHCLHLCIWTLDYKTRHPALIGAPGPNPEPHCWPLAGVPPYSFYKARVYIIRIPKRTNEMLANLYNSHGTGCTHSKKRAKHHLTQCHCTVQHCKHATSGKCKDYMRNTPSWRARASRHFL